jgi:hypothetical protein
MPKELEEERAIVLADWPPPMVVAKPRVYADDRSLVIRYRTAEDKTVIVRFPLCEYLAFGMPNDEALNGHPLYGRGLEFYSVHQVVDSSLIKALERRNAVHPRHDPQLYLKGMKHFIFTFQDSTLECVVAEEKWWKPTLKICASESEAEREWRQAETMGE